MNELSQGAGWGQVWLDADISPEGTGGTQHCQASQPKLSLHFN